MFILKNIPEGPEYRFGKIPLDEHLKIHAKRVPRKVCMIYYGTEISYQEMDQYVDQMATLLTNLGVKQGDTVGLFMQNCPQFSIAFWGIQRIGAIVSPFSPMFKEWDLEYELNELKAKVIIANSYMYPIIKSIKQSTSLEHIILSDVKYFVPESPTIPWTLKVSSPESVDDSVMMMESLSTIEINVPEVHRDMEDVSLIMFTSGTTGLPKGAMLTYFNALYKTIAGVQNFYFHDQSRLMQIQPMCHIAGMVFVNESLYAGSTICVLAAATPESACIAIEKYKLSSCYMTSLFAKMIIDLPNVKDYKLDYMRHAVTSGFGIPTSQSLIDEWDRLVPGSLMHEAAFGLTETHTADTFVPPELIIVGGNGVPTFAEMQVKIIENGKECAPGEVGEIVLKNKGIFKGYLNNPEATAEILKDGWLYTGDAGKLDEIGYLYFMGRRKEMIKCSGFSVFPDEVEMYLGRHEAVEKIIAIGKKDSRKGEIVKAFIVLRPQFKGKITELELIDWAKDKMATYKRPREIEFRDTLPINSTGKLLRRKLQEEEANSVESKQPAMSQ